MLLLASAADAKMGAARRLALRAVGQSAFHLGAGVLFLSSTSATSACSWGSTPLTNSAFLVAGNTLTKGIEVVDCNGYDLARRHTPFCRVELRHRRELSQSNKTSSFRAAAPRGAATLHRTMMSIFSHNGTA